ncbi:MAG: hypothetical protein CMC82_01760 [Flavobacteriaceae bacterium]|nr:hypothetical protein [Flavobacteriaceae bacterium]
MSKEDFVNAMVRDAELGYLVSLAEIKHQEYVLQRTQEQNPKYKVTRKSNKIYVRRIQTTRSTHKTQ